jgi:hypothetical protein
MTQIVLLSHASFSDIVMKVTVPVNSPSCARGFARITEFPDHRIAVGRSHDPLCGARCYAAGPYKIAHSCHIGGFDAFRLAKTGNLASYAILSFNAFGAYGFYGKSLLQ